MILEGLTTRPTGRMCQVFSAAATRFFDPFLNVLCAMCLYFFSDFYQVFGDRVPLIPLVTRGHIRVAMVPPKSPASFFSSCHQLRYRGEGRNSGRTETHWRLISMIFIEVKHLVVCSSFHHFKCVYIYIYIHTFWLFNA